MTTTTEAPTMTPELFDQWIEALESGKYAKGIGKLRTRECGAKFYCCLGVLCDLVGVDLDDVRVDDFGDGIMAGDMGGDTEDSTPDELAALIPATRMRIDIARLNDTSDTFEPVIDLLINRKNDLLPNASD